MLQLIQKSSFPSFQKAQHIAEMHFLCSTVQAYLILLLIEKSRYDKYFRSQQSSFPKLLIIGSMFRTEI